MTLWNHRCECTNKIRVHLDERCCHTRASYLIARVLLEWAVIEALDVCPLACSWRSLSTCYTTAAVGLFLYSRARRTSSSIWLSLLMFSRSRFASLFRDASRLCRHSASCLCRRSALSAFFSGLFSSFFCSGLCSALVYSLLSTLLLSLFCFCLISASTTPLARRVRLLHIHNHAQ